MECELKNCDQTNLTKSGFCFMSAGGESAGPSGVGEKKDGDDDKVEHICTCTVCV